MKMKIYLFYFGYRVANGMLSSDDEYDLMDDVKSHWEMVGVDIIQCIDWKHV